MAAKKPKTPDEFLAELKKIKTQCYDHEDDVEKCHIEMDELLCQTLSALGYDEGVNYYRMTPKWYA